MLVRSLLAFASLALAGAAKGACDVPPQARLAPPTVDGKPLEVAVQFTLIDIIAIKDAEQTFGVDLVFTADWRDPRLSAAALGGSLEGCRIRLEDIWHPDLGVLNRRDLTFIFGPRLSVSADGRVRQELRAFGNFSTRLDLRDFPFDSQGLRVSVEIGRAHV